MSEDEYQHKHFWDKPVCVEIDEKGNCLQSYSFWVFDLGPKAPIKQEQLFCEQVREKNDKTI